MKFIMKKNRLIHTKMKYSRSNRRQFCEGEVTQSEVKVGGASG